MSDKLKVIKIGVFFDGTGCNANNIFSDKGGKGENIGTNDSYSGYPSNIYKLYKLYGETESPTDWEKYLSVYVEGVGTKNGEADSVVVEATGVDIDIYPFNISGYGVFAKYENAVRYIADKLDKLLPQLGSSVCYIEYDIFGFSRGAAIARHFANMVYKNDKFYCEEINKVFARHNIEQHFPPEIKFLGLYDTVATVWKLSNAIWQDPHDTGDTNGLEVVLSDEISKVAFQIRAMQECRYNFPCHMLQGKGVEIVLPGCHSDIGGSYHLIENELTYPTQRYYYNFEYEMEESKNLAVQCLRKIQSRPLWRGLLEEAEIKGPKTDDHLRYFQGETSRKVKGELQFLYGRLMLEAAVEHGGCPFVKTSYDAQYSLPEELEPYYLKCKRIMGQAFSGQTQEAFSQDEIDFITKNYIHTSATWLNIISNNKQENDIALVSIFSNAWPNRPDIVDGYWERKLFK